MPLYSDEPPRSLFVAALAALGCPALRMHGKRPPLPAPLAQLAMILA